MKPLNFDKTHKQYPETESVEKSKLSILYKKQDEWQKNLMEFLVTLRVEYTKIDSQRTQQTKRKWHYMKWVMVNDWLDKNILTLYAFHNNSTTSV